MAIQLRYHNIEINGVPILAHDLRIKNPFKGRKFVEKEVMNRGLVLIPTMPLGREFSFKFTIQAKVQEILSYLDGLQDEMVELKSPYFGRVQAAITNIELEFLNEMDYTTEDGVYKTAEITIEAKEGLPPGIDQVVEQEQPAPQPQTPTTTTTEILQVKCKPSCAFCMKYDGYQYVYYIASFENYCPHCKKKNILTKQVDSRVPEGQLHCTAENCGANYCCVCGREKVWDKVRAEKYRLNVIQKAKKED